MNVQKKIFEVLAKKQELGAIEDAINEVKSNLTTKGEDLTIIINDYNDIFNEYQNKAVQLGEEFRVLIQDLGNQWDEKQKEFLESAKELDDLSIPYDDTLGEYGSDFKDIYSKSVDLLNVLTRI